MCLEGSREEAQNSTTEKHLCNFARKTVPRNWTQQNPQFSNTLVSSLTCSPWSFFVYQPIQRLSLSFVQREVGHQSIASHCREEAQGSAAWDLLSRNQAGLPRVSRGSWSLLWTFSKLVTWTNNHKFTVLSVPEVDKPVGSWISEGPSTEWALPCEHVNVAIQANQPPKMRLFHSRGAPEQWPKCVSLQEPQCCALSSFLLWMQHNSHWGCEPVPGSIDVWLRIKFRQLRPVNSGLKKGQMLAASEARCFRTRELNNPGFPKPFLSSQSSES